MMAVVHGLQSCPFAQEIIGRARWQQTDEGLVYVPTSIHDYGCGEGDGTVLLKSYFPFANVKGLDFWPKAVEIAEDRWTDRDIVWEVGDVSEPKESCDLLFAVQTMDHVDDPSATISECLKFCDWLIVAWAKLPHKTAHPSNYLQSLPPFVWGAEILKPRPVRETGQVVKDTIQLMIWKSSERKRRSKLVA